MGSRLGLTCVLITALEPVSCFLAGTTKAAIPCGIGPHGGPQQQQHVHHVAHQNRAQTSPSISMVAQAQAPIAWPDEATTPLPDQPIRARILAVAPGEVASPFEDRGKAVPWFEVCPLLCSLRCGQICMKGASYLGRVHEVGRISYWPHRLPLSIGRKILRTEQTHFRVALVHVWNVEC